MGKLQLSNRKLPSSETDTLKYASGRALAMSSSVLTNGNCEVENELHKLGKNHFVLTLDRLVAAVRFFTDLHRLFHECQVTYYVERKGSDPAILLQSNISPHPAFAKITGDWGINCNPRFPPTPSMLLV